MTSPWRIITLYVLLPSNMSAHFSLDGDNYQGTQTLQWRNNEHDGVSIHQPHHCLLNRLLRRRSKKTSKLRVTGLCAGNSPMSGEFPAQMFSNAENISIWWRHYDGIWHVNILYSTIVKYARLWKINDADLFSKCLLSYFIFVNVARFFPIY